MLALSYLSLFLIATLVQSTPLTTLDEPSVTVESRDEETPSDYPWASKDDPALTNEFKWLGWVKENEDDKKDGLKVHQAFKEWVDFAKAVDDKITDPEHKIYKRWFGKQYKPEEVGEVFKNMFDQKKGEATKNVAAMTLYRKDFENRCSEKKSTKAYMIPGTGKFHVCPQGFLMSMNSDLKCKDFDKSVSTKMRSLPMTLLHEMTHFDKIGSDATNELIEDIASTAYDCFKLDDDEKPTNAQNFAWMAADAYWGSEGNCNKEYDDPSEDTKEEPEDHNSPTPIVQPECTNVKFDANNGYIFRDTLSDLINNTYCPKLEGMKSSIGPGSYLADTPETVEIGVTGGFRAPTFPSVDDCKTHLHEVLDRCDVGAEGSNPMNWKAGGKVEVDKWIYSLRLLHDRPAAPNRPKAWCKIDNCGKSGCTASMWGAGWESSNFGHTLRSKIDEFTDAAKKTGTIGEHEGYDTSKWDESFKYEFRDGHEWHASLPVNLGIFRKFQELSTTTVTIMKSVANNLDVGDCEVIT